MKCALRNYTYLGTVRGMCRRCRSLVPCRVFERDGAVYQEPLCPSCERTPTRIADSLHWYLRMMRTTVHCKEPHLPGSPVRSGCPLDCGPCSFHANACRLPVFSVTNVCNMRCPICFTHNRPDRPWFMTRDSLRRLLDNVVERAAPLDLVNVTGGEPTLHPDILSLLDECSRPEIGRVTLNSNGLRLAEDETLCRELAARGVYVILSFHTLHPETSKIIHGADVTALKLRALENLQRHGVGTTLLNVMIRDVNEHEIGDVIDLARRFPVVRSVTVQTMTYTGQGGASFSPRRRIPCDGAANAIERATGARMRAIHFFPHPGAHPLCYNVAYYLRTNGSFRSFTDLLTPEALRDMLSTGYLPCAGDSTLDHLRSAVDQFWARGEDEDLLRRCKMLLSTLYPPGTPLTPFQRQRLAEERILSVYLHSHMDEDTLDLARLVVCPDQVPDEEGRMIPACAYNIFYRRRDERFFAPE